MDMSTLRALQISLYFDELVVGELQQYKKVVTGLKHQPLGAFLVWVIVID